MYLKRIRKPQTPECFVGSEGFGPAVSCYTEQFHFGYPNVNLALAFDKRPPCKHTEGVFEPAQWGRVFVALCFASVDYLLFNHPPLLQLLFLARVANPVRPTQSSLLDGDDDDELSYKQEKAVDLRLLECLSVGKQKWQLLLIAQ